MAFGIWPAVGCQNHPQSGREKLVLLKSPNAHEASISGEPPAISIKDQSTGRMLVQTVPGEAVFFYETAQGRRPLNAPTTLEPAGADGYRASYQLEGSDKAVLDVRWSAAGTLRAELEIESAVAVERTGVLLHARPDEHFAGLMERVVDGSQEASWAPGLTAALDLRGQRVEMFVKPIVSLYAPFYLSSAGYGLFVEGTAPGMYDIAATRNDVVSVAFAGRHLKLHLIPGPAPMDILRRYSALAGSPLLPPRWAFMPWRYRDELTHSTTLYDGTKYDGPYNSQLVEDVLMFDALDIPMGVYLIDRPWAIGEQGYDDFQWDEKRLPSPERMVRWLTARGIRLTLWLAPWVSGRIAQEASGHGYALPGTEGRRPHVDFTKPAAVRWWQAQLEKLIANGIAGFKIDRGDEEVPSSNSILAGDGRTMRDVHNDYPRLYAEAARDALAKQRDTDFVLLARAGYTGSQKSALFWAGDTHSSEWGLRSAVIAGQRAAVMGFPFWGTDIGGYYGRLDREVIARWMAFGCFSPIMHIGPLGNRAPWDMPTEPRYDAELIAVLRLYAKLHAILEPYSYRHAELAHQSGVPLIRPMFFDELNAEAAWQNWQQFFYGADLLVAVPWRKGVRQLTMYLPPGEWRDAWNGALHQGPGSVVIDTPFHKIPIFVRAGGGTVLPDLEALWRESLAKASVQPDLTAALRLVRSPNN